MDFVETVLPGVGVRYDTRTRSGIPLSVLIGHGGEAEVCTYQVSDPDAVAYRVQLEPNEAAALGELLGAARMTTRVADLTKEIPGLSSARFEIQPGSRYDGRRLGDSKARTRTGCSIVAVVRGKRVYAAPSPRAALHAGDVVVATGSEAGLASLAQILAMSPDDEPFPLPDDLDELDDPVSRAPARTDGPSAS